jgi:hypothetical protein
VGEVHANRCPFAKDWEAVFVLFEELAADSKRVIGGVSHTEHPLVSADGADRFADLVCQSLESELMISGCKGGADAIGWSVLILDLKKDLDRFFEVTSEKVFVSIEGNGPGIRGWKFFRKMKAMNCLQEEDGTDPVVEVFRSAAEIVQLGAFLKEGLGVEGRAGFRQRAIANCRILCGDE